MNRGSRSSVLSQQLFHGSYAELNPGDIIEPKDHDHAYAFGKARHASDFGSVYQVTPLDPVEKRQETVQWRKSNKLHMAGGDVHVSKKGFKVVGKK
jgi:hypothetical protein